MMQTLEAQPCNEIENLNKQLEESREEAKQLKDKFEIVCEIIIRQNWKGRNRKILPIVGGMFLDVLLICKFF